LGVKTIVEGDAECAGDVVIAGAGGAEAIRSTRNEGAGRGAGEDAEGFECAGHLAVLEIVITMFALDHYGDQMFVLEAAQVHAGGGGSDAGKDSQLGGGSRTAIH
jgi:hypothetical protein